MALWRLTLGASAFALHLASQAVAEERLALPEPPEPAPVVIGAADAAFPEPPEPAPVVIDVVATPIVTEAPASAVADKPADATTETSATTASLPPAQPIRSIDELIAAIPVPDAAETSFDGVEVAAAPATSRPLDELLAAIPMPEAAEPDWAGAPAPPVMASLPPPAPVAPVALAAPDIAPVIAERLAAAVRHTRLPDREEQAVAAFYAARGHHPLWVEDGRFAARARAVQAMLAEADADGLNPVDYRVSTPSGDTRALADADIALSLAVVLYARDARGGRLDPRRLSALITPRLSLPDTAALLAEVAETPDPAKALAAYQPPHEGYRKLKAKLSELRAQRPAAVPSVRIPVGPNIRVGMRDERVTLLRMRFGMGPSDDRTYDRTLATQIAGFQRENGLPATGILNRQTQDMLNGGSGMRLEGDLVAAMERWRWLPADLGEDHIIVNVPEFMVRKIEDRRVVHEAKVVVGRPERPTPIFSDMMDHIVVNPSWTIPPTILRQDILPKLAVDPGYAERRGLQVIRRGNSVSVRQPPGPSNALGAVKLMFPNDHAVYLHDTPTRSHFALARRAYSSGCVRVERPMKLAELALGGPQSGWSESRLRAMVGSGERTIRLQNRMPIHLVYMTHEVGADGSLKVHEDLYGFHRRTREALGL